jgi:hypothetical protein
MKVDTLQWKEFDFNKVFSITRGKRLTTANQISGDIAYISSTKTNNGIDNYVVPPKKHLIFNNAITLNNSGSIGYCFYHSYNFIASDHCTILDIKDKNIKLNITLFLFLKPVIEVMKQKYGFAREMSNDRLKKEKILLPAKDNLPDWEYMRNYIKGKAEDVIYDNDVAYPKNTIVLNSVKWQEFNIDIIFKYKRGVNISKENQIYGDIPYISSTKENNGISNYIKKPFNVTTYKNSITLNNNGSIGYCFYHSYEFIASSDCTILTLNNISINKFIFLFLKSIIEKFSKVKYSYGRKISNNKLKKEIILLPVDKNNQPNWQFMEDYIKSLPYSKSL